LKNNSLRFPSIRCWSTFAIIALTMFSCGVTVQYSMTGIATTAQTISITEFYNNADLGPANMGQTFTNSLKDYFIQNTSLTVVAEEGELQMDGEITNFSVTDIAPTATSDPNALNRSASSRLTITVRATYIDTKNEKMSFKDKTFSFYKDFSNDLTVTDVQDQFTKEIFDRIINDIFNASVANW
jgi:hypothetical protein